ncbi:hypothetical protein BT96DRAFT_355551 [Gymnopus androsaceus JB14]|uniref:Uncharacterized protein n=1 Tax=Gymnopus androsaceus JB14 TaxID=1447944 RepID=A0A6A4GW91_9AGAR|nr:hypothetical protein BT96DRAFT_355551 [Gymnopus androsaceus JB14]
MLSCSGRQAERERGQLSRLMSLTLPSLHPIHLGSLSTSSSFTMKILDSPTMPAILPNRRSMLLIMLCIAKLDALLDKARLLFRNYSGIALLSGLLSCMTLVMFHYKFSADT